MKTRIIAKAAIFLPSGEVLAVRRSKTDVRRPLQWDLPGGYCDEGELPTVAVIREIQEETGLKVDEVSLCFSKTEIRSWINEDRGESTENVVFLFYKTVTNTKTVKLSYEHSEYEWMKHASAIDSFEYPLHKQFLKHLLDNNLVKS